MKLGGKTAIVTGGGRGIGRSIAARFAAEGASVVVTARSASEIDETVSSIRKAGGQAVAVRTDVSREADVDAMVLEAVRRFGSVDILVNNAAVNLPRINVVDMDPSAWREVIDVNLTGAFLCARAVLPHMIRQKSGNIINISSIGGRRGEKGRGPYRASKAALINFTETLAAETHHDGIRVNCICPGGVDTEMQRQISLRPPGSRALIRPDEIAALALFLAGDDSSAVTGTSVDAFGVTNPLFS